MEEKRSINRYVWLLLSLAACAIAIAYTASPVFKNPQLDPDDYRYLEQVQLLTQDFFGHIAQASVVENRWDQLWWINIHEKIRFFRPTVVFSYWLDDVIYGSNNPLGLVRTNMLIYAICVILACFILYCWVGPGIHYLLSSVLFAVFLRALNQRITE